MKWLSVVDAFGNEVLGCHRGSRGQAVLVFMFGTRVLFSGNRNQLELA